MALISISNLDDSLTNKSYIPVTVKLARKSVFNAETFEMFLSKLLRHRKRSGKMVLILDNARYHHARKLKPLPKKYQKFLRLDYLPAYSPELNPIERIWKLLRKNCTHNQYFETLEDLVDAVDTEVAAWKTPNPVLRKLCGIS